mmetsp:Transcript_47916/g.111785  ORF Transcript_47916/g.111785 Transcript_47916/m.111785 type:complete len:170 (+) Transcript_47916:146-655(+)
MSRPISRRDYEDLLAAAKDTDEELRVNFPGVKRKERIRKKRVNVRRKKAEKTPLVLTKNRFKVMVADVLRDELGNKKSVTDYGLEYLQIAAETWLAGLLRDAFKINLHSRRNSRLTAEDMQTAGVVSEDMATHLLKYENMMTKRTPEQIMKMGLLRRKYKYKRTSTKEE